MINIRDLIVNQGFAKAILGAGGGSGGSGGAAADTKPKESKAVDFYNIYGDIVYSYTKTEAAALTELPPGPQINGYDFDTWTATLADVQGVKAFLDIGPRYKKDGKFVSFAVVNAEANVEIPFYVYAAVDIKLDVDWGDGSTNSYSLTANTNPTMKHSYSKKGVYTIGFTHTGSSVSIFRFGLYTTNSTTSRTNAFVGGSDNKFRRTLLSCSGGGMAGYGAFNTEYDLKYLDVSKGYASSIYFCPSLRVYTSNIRLAAGQGGNFTSCYSLKRLWCYPNASGECNSVNMDICISQMGTFPFSSSYYFRRIIILGNVTSTTTPTGSFNTSYLEAIYVPDEYVSTYKANSFFKTYASYIKPLSEYPDY